MKPPSRSTAVGWELRHGPVTGGLEAIHRCETTRCVNPAHLFLGTDQSKVDTMRARGRLVNPRGEEHGRAKRTEEGVKEVRRRYRPWHPVHGLRPLAREFRVSHRTIQCAVRGLSWAHVPGAREEGG
jgi:hypothetical protein